MSTTSPAREAFEAWYRSSHTLANLSRAKKGYIDNTTRVAWRAWQAAISQPDHGGVCGQCGGWVCDPIPALTAQHEQAMQDQITHGIGITQGGQRVDPTSIYKQPEQWADYLKEGETTFERFMRERKDLDALMTLYQRAVAENEQLKAQQQEPVAWLYDWIAYGHEGETVVRDWISADYDEAHSPTSGCHNIRPLYTSQPASKPLTESRIMEIFNSDNSNLGDGVVGFVRAIEADHGIKGDA